jgi:hypothetical protein
MCMFLSLCRVARFAAIVDILLSATESAMILALQAREQLRKSITRRVVKLLLFIFIQSHRGQRRVAPAGADIPSQRVPPRTVTVEQLSMLANTSKKLCAVHTKITRQRLPKPRARLPRRRTSSIQFRAAPGQASSGTATRFHHSSKA